LEKGKGQATVEVGEVPVRASNAVSKTESWREKKKKDARFLEEKKGRHQGSPAPRSISQKGPRENLGARRKGKKLSCANTHEKKKKRDQRRAFYLKGEGPSTDGEKKKKLTDGDRRRPTKGEKKKGDPTSTVSQRKRGVAVHPKKAHNDYSGHASKTEKKKAALPPGFIWRKKKKKNRPGTLNLG